MTTQVDGITVDSLKRHLPPVVFDAATDYVVAGRLAGLTKLGRRLGGRVRGHNGGYRAAIDLTEPPSFACDCGRDQPCRHAAALALAWARDPEAFIDLEPLLAGWRGDAAESALRHIADRCFGPDAPDSADAVLELAGGTGDADPLRLEAFLESVTGLAVVARRRAPALVAELRARAAELGRRQGRTGAVRALAALVAASGQLIARPGWSGDSELIAEAAAAVRDMDALLIPGGLDATALVPSLIKLAEILPLLPQPLLSPVLHAGSRMSAGAADYLTHRLRAATELAKADLALSSPGGDGATRVRELVGVLVQFLLSRGLDSEALLVGRAEARGPAGAVPLVEALAGSGRRDEAIAAAREGLARAAGNDVVALRRHLADLLGQADKPDLALAYLAANYNEHPDSNGYAELRALAVQCGNWEDMRPGALARLRSGTNPRAFAEAAAIEARALEPGSPDVARRVLIDSLLDMPPRRARDGDADDWMAAVQLLLRESRRLLRRLGDEPGWRELRDECRRRYGV